jgi:hypothetical protein
VGIAHQTQPIAAFNGGQCPPYTIPLISINNEFKTQNQTFFISMTQTQKKYNKHQDERFAVNFYMTWSIRI